MSATVRWVSVGMPATVRWVAVGMPATVRWVAVGMPATVRWVAVGMPATVRWVAGECRILSDGWLLMSWYSVPSVRACHTGSDNGLSPAWHQVVI